MPAHPIPAQAWDSIRAEFTLPSLDQVRRRLSELMEDPEPIMRQLVRVFLSGLLRVDVCPCSEEEPPACRITQDRPLSLSMNSSAWAKFRAIFAR